MPQRLVEQEAVEAIMREAADTILRPYFQNLQTGQVREKSAGDFVTIADEESEKFLSARLQALLPNSVVVGEEAVEFNPDHLLLLDQMEKPVWIIDPLDGTANFASGYKRFGIIIALVYQQKILQGWIYDVPNDRMAYAERGMGTYLNGKRCHYAPHILQSQSVHDQGIICCYNSIFMPQEMHIQLAVNGSWLNTKATYICSAHEHIDILNNSIHCSLYGKANPWDYAAGSLMIREMGGCTLTLAGTPYKPTSDSAGKGIIIAPNRSVAASFHKAIFYRTTLEGSFSDTDVPNAKIALAG